MPLRRTHQVAIPGPDPWDISLRMKAWDDTKKFPLHDIFVSKSPVNTVHINGSNSVGHYELDMVIFTCQMADWDKKLPGLPCRDVMDKHNIQTVRNEGRCTGRHRGRNASNCEDHHRRSDKYPMHVASGSR